jgi:hypothetical protein
MGVCLLDMMFAIPAFKVFMFNGQIINIHCWTSQDLHHGKRYCTLQLLMYPLNTTLLGW